MKTFDNREQALEYVQSLSITQVMNLCADLIMETQTPKIFLTQQQFEKFFKVQGLRVVPETRGRNRKNEEFVTE
jgi:hypothetical protein